MLAISGYEIVETIQDEINKVIYRWIRQTNQKPVILLWKPTVVSLSVVLS